MSSNLTATIVDAYHNIVLKNGDPRLENWFMMSTPFPTIYLVIAYFAFVKIGPELMKNRKPFELKNAMIAYNTFQTFFSTWMFYHIGMCGWFTGYSFICEPVDYSDDPKALGMLSMHWYFFMSKFTEFTDTVFFILRKKQNQVSKLHIIHHTLVPSLTWISVKYVGTGQFTFPGLLNTFVHIIMYGYYMLAAMGPEVRKYLWWKKYLTTLQLTQFVVILVHAFTGLFGECDIPKGFLIIIFFPSFLFYFMFTNFYNQSYTKQQPEKLKAQPVKQKPQKKEPIKTPTDGGLTYWQNAAKEFLGMCIPDQSLLLSPSSPEQNKNYIKMADM